MKIIMDNQAINRALSRISHEIIENNKGTKDIIILGIKTRGVPLAQRIVEKIKWIEGVEVPFDTLDITFYRDDLDMKSSQPIVHNELQLEVKNRIVILVDDVIFTGRTCRAALDAVMNSGRAKKVQFVALVDRGHRELPLTPDYIGKNVPTSKDEIIHVHLLETDLKDEVILSSSKL